MSLSTSLWRFANPALFLTATQKILPLLWTGAIVTTILGLGWGFFFTPNDYQQGSSVKIMFVHVPAAMMAINCWVMMLVACFGLVYPPSSCIRPCCPRRRPCRVNFHLDWFGQRGVMGRTDLGDLLGVGSTAILVFNSAILLYRVYRLGDGQHQIQTKLPTSARCSVWLGRSLPFYRVMRCRFWEQGLHQGSSIPVIATGERKIDAVFFYPLILTMVGFFLIFIALVLVRTGNEIRTRQTAMLNTLILEETDA